jgi:hypothetical protein
LAARRDRRLGLSAAVDAADRADRTEMTPELPSRSSPAPIGCAARDLMRRCGGLYRRGGAGSDRRRRPDGGRPPRRRLCSPSLRPTGSMPAGPRHSAHASAASCMRARISSGCSPTCRRIAASSACSTATRRRWPGSARSRPSHASARGRAFRPDRIDRRPLPALRHRRQRHHRRRAGDRTRPPDKAFEGAELSDWQLQSASREVAECPPVPSDPIMRQPSSTRDSVCLRVRRHEYASAASARPRSRLAAGNRPGAG